MRSSLIKPGVLLAAIFMLVSNAFAQKDQSGADPAFLHNLATKWQAHWIQIGYPEDSLNHPSQYFSKQFDSSGKVKQARLFITSRGLYEAQINGKRVGNAYLTPGWTSYNKRIAYQAWDVTDLVKKGDNILQVTLGDGWYRGALAFENRRNYFGTKLSLICQLEVTYTNGRKEIIISDDSWKSGEGPIRQSSINNGETIDHNRVMQIDKPVRIADDYAGKLVPTESYPATKHEVFKPIKVITTPKGEKVLDFGQNLVGWVMLKVKGKQGDTITIQHAEVLDKAGNFYIANLRGAQAKSTYILKGQGEEFFEPHFTYFGFRYIQIKGLRADPDPEDFTAVAIYADMQPSGTFECSNPMLNKLQHNIQWGQKGNFLYVPTDCPQRDERLGWTGDAQVFAHTAAYNFDVQYFFKQWMVDVALDQRKDGAVTFVVPDILDGAAGSAGWGDVSTVVPWTMYQVYGDKEILQQQYESMKKWVGFMTQNSTNDLWNKGDHFGDWLSYHSPTDDGSDAITDKYEIAQCFYAYSTQLVINAARVLGKTEDVNYYSALLNRIKDAYRKEYTTYSGRILSNTQSSYVLALQFDMLLEKDRPTAASYLVSKIRAYDHHLTTGFLGTPYLCHVLSRFGHTKEAYRLLLQDTYPSWLYPIKMGATTIWERWDGIKPDGSFQTTAMNSFNHYAYGAIGDWMYQHIAGIQAGSPGYKQVIIRPDLGGGLTWCKASYICPQGKIIVSWKIADGKFTLDATIPKGSAAVVYLPDAEGKNIQQKNISAGNYHFSN
ncbi:family 78 glycoside hydrolase catalytic domain [Mucilaginibacter sp. 21P]|uniref:family 78 glycoside hydrolase catalytic domain n=1 Tax=Mucilaginibacter sp. 21P TaxID=2778902 RepID=UPI001C57E134|nr:family 78 glycoside hydrolase catalytic domain [Mucilaginibacter sp. 21P]QXV67183.1 family 78 glycoside hydrolase catalytic domain [Mucilaginibacter sp. 21P]